MNPFAASIKPEPIPVTFPALRTFVSPYNFGMFWNPCCRATCISEVAFSGKVVRSITPPGGSVGSFAKPLPKSTPDPIAAEIEPVTGSHYHVSLSQGN